MIVLIWLAPRVHANCIYLYGDVADPLRHERIYYTCKTVEHGLKDNKGRTIGSYAEIEARPRPIIVDKRCVGLESKLTYSVMTQATRDGKMFGAIATRGTLCDSLEAAQALAAKKIAAAGKRFARAVANGGGNPETTPKAVQA